MRSVDMVFPAVLFILAMSILPGADERLNNDDSTGQL
jgi:hypothetical protein